MWASRFCCTHSSSSSSTRIEVFLLSAQLPRFAGRARATNVFVCDMDLAIPNALESRRMEVVSDGLTLLRGAQLAIDTTMVSPLRRDATTRPGSANFDGAVLEVARRRKEATYPELSGEGGRARLVVLAAEVGGRWSVETAQFLTTLAKARAQEVLLVLQGRAESAWVETVERHFGVHCCPCFCQVTLGQAHCLWLRRGPLSQCGHEGVALLLSTVYDLTGA